MRLGGCSVHILGQFLCEALSFRQTPHQRLDVAVIALLPRGLSSAQRRIRQRWYRGQPESHEQRQRRLAERILVPPKPDNGEMKDTAPSDDWSRLPIPTAKTAEPVPKTGAPAPDDRANAGVRREPDLPKHEEIAPAPKKQTPEFTFAGEKTDDEAARAEILRLRARGL
jgi:hypothetical protein